ncbi:MAG: hypothetical protein WD771_11175, partial [Gemmatimonadaceae bacterium]
RGQRRGRAGGANAVSACRAVARTVCAVALAAAPLAAQAADSARAGITRPPASARDTAALTGLPPISPRRAFLYSLVLPGAGQSQLGRAYAGGLFVFIEITALTLVNRSNEDLRIARRFRSDSMPLRYQLDPVTGVVARDSLGQPVVAAWARSRYTDAWIRTRRLHREDWVAVLVFNHLFAGADAFVAAQLWDLPAKLALRATPEGPALTATLTFRGSKRRRVE